MCYNTCMRNNWNLPENEQRLRDAAAQCISVTGMCRILGLAPKGGNIGTLRHHIVRLNIDVTHHKGQGWNKENYSSPMPTHKNVTIRKRLIREKGHTCWSCNLSEWMGKPIPLELDHIDGNNRNNDEINLRILCCNCHAQTPTWRNQKREPAV